MKKLLILITLHASLFTLHDITAQETTSPMVSQNIWFYKSGPIRELPVVLPGEHKKEQRVAPNKFTSIGVLEQVEFPSPDLPLIQKDYGSRFSRGPLMNFAGIDNVNGRTTADPNGDVGPDHYVQIVNSSFAVWDKTGNLLCGPVSYNTIWASFPGPWNTLTWGDPVVKYDQMADRWVIVSLAINLSGTEFYTMIAVSTTPDPIGSYYCYAYSFEDQCDYPKISVWPNAYYVTLMVIDFFTNDYFYTLYAAVNRDAMLNGDTLANMIGFEVVDPGGLNLFPLPADCRGSLVPTGEPCPFMKMGRHIPTNPWYLSLDVYEFETDWNIPLNSTFQQVFQHDIGHFEPLSNFFGPGAPQLGSDINVLTIPLYMMNPLTYRMFSDHESLVGSFTTWDGEQHYISWYELRKDNGNWFIYQNGNYAPGNEHYFFPGISINGNGDMAMAYSVSGEDMYPSIRFTGRRAGDEPGVMTYQELEVYKGLRYADSYIPYLDCNHWGDYSSMMVDPTDDTTFWYTKMYATASTQPGNWATRVFTFNLSEDTAWPYAFAGNDTVAPGVLFFETQGEAENYSSIFWTTGGDGNFISNYAEQVTYLRGPGDLSSGQVTLTMHLTGYYPDSEAADSMVLYLKDTLIQVQELRSHEMNLEIFPNPAYDMVTIRADLPSDDPVILKIISGSGREIFTGRYKPVNRYLERQFDFSYLPKGVYVVELRAEGEGHRAVEKVVKMD